MVAHRATDPGGPPAEGGSDVLPEGPLAPPSVASGSHGSDGAEAAPASLGPLLAYLADLADGRGDTTAPLPPVARDLEPLAAALRRLVGDWRATLQAVQAETGRLAIATARSTFQVAEAAREQQRRTEEASASLAAIRGAIEGLAASAEAVARASSEASEVAEHHREVARHSLESSERAKQVMDDSAAEMRKLADGSREVDAITEIIDDIAGRINLLALNAAIEAARAGEHGRGFNVVAAEVRRLAEQTASSTKAIFRTIQGLREQIRLLEEVVSAGVRAAEEAVASARQTGEAFDQIAGLVRRASGDVQRVASASEDVLATAGRVDEQVQFLSAQARETAEKAGALFASAEMAGGIEEIHRLLGRYYTGSFVDQVREWAWACAREVQAAIEAVIDAGRLRLEDLLDWRYREVRGADVRLLARLFDVSRVPPSGFDPPKYVTGWDAAVDREVQAVLDRYAQVDRRVINVAAPDLNGYHYAHLSRHTRAWTGDPARDLVGNRIKRIFDNRVELRAARVGLPAERVKRRATRQEFLAAGVDPDTPTDHRVFLLQTYARDTGEIMHDLAVPLWVKGRRFGAIRIGFRTDGS